MSLKPGIAKWTAIVEAAGVLVFCPCCLGTKKGSEFSWGRTETIPKGTTVEYQDRTIGGMPVVMHNKKLVAVMRNEFSK